MRISDWSSVVCSSDLADVLVVGRHEPTLEERRLVIGVVAVFVGVVRLEGGWQDGGICHDQRSEVGAGATGAAAGVGMVGAATGAAASAPARSEEHTYELQSLMRISYAVFCLKKNKIDR